jgi:hypothetical protein
MEVTNYSPNTFRLENAIIGFSRFAPNKATVYFITQPRWSLPEVQPRRVDRDDG